MLPAHQRLEPVDPAIAVTLRLVFEVKFAVLDRRTKIVLHGATVPQLPVHRTGKDRVVPAAFMLGAIERASALASSAAGVVAIARVERHADAEVDVQRVAVDFDRLPEGVAHRPASSSAAPGNGTCSAMAMNSSPPTRAT
jgi:hypothetical protein